MPFGAVSGYFDPTYRTLTLLRLGRDRFSTTPARRATRAFLPSCSPSTSSRSAASPRMPVQEPCDRRLNDPPKQAAQAIKTRRPSRTSCSPGSAVQTSPLPSRRRATSPRLVSDAACQVAEHRHRVAAGFSRLRSIGDQPEERSDRLDSRIGEIAIAEFDRVFMFLRIFAENRRTSRRRCRRRRQIDRHHVAANPTACRESLLIPWNIGSPFRIFQKQP